jgi:hypothetical protein
MNDDFFIRFRKSPRQEFVSALYKRINIPMNKQTNIPFRRALAAIALCLALIAIFASSQTVRAAFQALMREIGGITYVQPEETTDEPTPAPDEPSPRVREVPVNFSELPEKVPFAISLPTWTPDGFIMAQTVMLRYFDGNLQMVYVTWDGPDVIKGPIRMLVGPRINWAVDLDHLQEVQVNGQPAGLTHGGWDADTGEWGGAGAGNVTLTWIHGDLMYQLMSPAVTDEELIRMAESVP